MLAGLGHVFARVARNPTSMGEDREALRQEVTHIRVVLAGLKQQTHDFAKTALIAWESRNE